MLGFRSYVFKAVFGSESRHQKRSCIWQGGGTQIQARWGKHADSGSGSLSVWRPREEKARGEEQDILTVAACALGHIENTEEKCRKRSEIYLGTRLENCRCYTHRHTHIYHSWQIHSTTHQKDTRTSLSISSYQVGRSAFLAPKLTVKKMNGWGRGEEIKVCCVQSSKRLWPSHQLLPRTVHASAVRTVVQLARSSKN